jgi:23S rRNA pseudouridine2605 synthase
MEALIEEGLVTVNGAVASLGMRIDPSDRVQVKRKAVRLNFSDQLPQVLIYHKPEGEIVSRNDPQERPTVFANLPIVKGHKWISVGRLDFNTSGLLLLTTSGELANTLTHPRNEFEREYAVRVVGELSSEQMQQSCRQIVLEDGPAHFESIRDMGGEGTNHWYQVVLKEGRNREVRRMFQAMNILVGRLIRVRFGPVSLPPRLRRGQLQELDSEQVHQLMRLVGLDDTEML